MQRVAIVDADELCNVRYLEYAHIRAYIKVPFAAAYGLIIKIEVSAPAVGLPTPNSYDETLINERYTVLRTLQACCTSPPQPWNVHCAYGYSLIPLCSHMFVDLTASTGE